METTSKTHANIIGRWMPTSIGFEPSQYTGVFAPNFLVYDLNWIEIPLLRPVFPEPLKIETLIREQSLADKFAEFAHEDICLAEEGIEEYNDLLKLEDEL